MINNLKKEKPWQVVGCIVTVGVFQFEPRERNHSSAVSFLTLCICNAETDPHVQTEGDMCAKLYNKNSLKCVAAVDWQCAVVCVCGLGWIALGVILSISVWYLWVFVYVTHFASVCVVSRQQVNKQYSLMSSDWLPPGHKRPRRWPVECSYRLHADRVGASTLWVSLTQECETLFKELESERRKQEWSCTKTRGELVLLKNWFPSRKRNTGCSSSNFPLRSTWFTREVKPGQKPLHSLTAAY